MRTFFHRLGRSERKSLHCDLILPDPDSHETWAGTVIYRQDSAAGRHDMISSVSVVPSVAWYGGRDRPLGTPLKWCVFILRSGLAIGPPVQLDELGFRQVFDGVIPKGDILCCGSVDDNPTSAMVFKTRQVVETYDRICFCVWLDKYFDLQEQQLVTCFTIAITISLK
jgi:hypothetical protein